MTAAFTIGIGYGLVATASLLVWRRNRRLPPSSSVHGVAAYRTNPRLLLMTAALLSIMALGRIGGLAASAAAVGRDIARTEGWYGNRRPLQALVLFVLSFLWITLVAHTVAHRARRTRGEVPITIAISALMMLASTRTLSFHYADSAFNQSRVVGLRVGDWVEIVGLMATLGILLRLGHRAQALAGDPTLHRGLAQDRPHVSRSTQTDSDQRFHDVVQTHNDGVQHDPSESEEGYLVEHEPQYGAGRTTSGAMRFASPHAVDSTGCNSASILPHSSSRPNVTADHVVNDL